MPDKINVKVKMPMIPLRDVVIFPNTVSTLFVGREKSIFSLEDALRTNKKIFLVAQNSPSNEEPTIEDLPTVGTISTLLQMIKLPDGTVKILVEGLQRASLEEVIIDKGYFAHIQKIEEQIEDSKYERDLLANHQESVYRICISIKKYPLKLLIRSNLWQAYQKLLM